MQTRSSGEVLAAAEGAGWVEVLDRHQNEPQDSEIARRIKGAGDPEGAQIVAGVRRGTTLGAVAVGVSTALGAVGGALAQKAMDNYGVRGIPVSAPAGAVVATLGALAPFSAHTRHALVAGGTAWVAGTVLYHRHAARGLP